MNKHLFISKKFTQRLQIVVQKISFFPSRIHTAILGGCFLLLHLTAFASFDISWNHDYYVTPTNLKNALNQYSYLELKTKHNNYSNNWFYGMEGVSSFFFDTSNQKYLAVPNLFFGYEMPNIVDDYTVNWIIGRYRQSMSMLYDDKKSSQLQAQPEFWSVMDEVWEMGLWQSQINWDYLSPKQQGLVGSLLTVKKEPWMLTVFFGLFLPDHGPSVDVTSKGKVQSTSRWFIPPQSNFVLFNQRIDTLYWLDAPYLKNILLNDSVAVRFRFGDIHKQWMSMSYAYKPINQIYFTADSGLSINKTTINNIIYYQLFDHSIFSIDFGMKEKWGLLVLSVIQELPFPHPSDPHQMIPILPKAVFFSSHLRLNTQNYLFMKYIDLNVIYSRMKTNGENHSQNVVNQLSQALPDNRFKLHHGFSVTAKSRNFHLRKQKISFHVRYWHSIPEAGDWLNSSIQWDITPHLRLTGGMDILGSGREGGFFHTYKQNDRITLKVSYVTR